MDVEELKHHIHQELFGECFSDMTVSRDWKEQRKEAIMLCSVRTMQQFHQYFSPESIRERYDQHNNSLAADSSDPLLDIARETVGQMRLDGKTNDEIRTVLESKFHLLRSGKKRECTP